MAGKQIQLETDVSDDQRAFVAPYLSLTTADAPRRRHNLRGVSNALRWIVRAGSTWRSLPVGLPPWEAVYQHTRRWLAAGCFDATAYDLRELLRWAAGRHSALTAVLFGSSTRPTTLESGHWTGYDGYKRRHGSKSRLVVDTLEHLLAIHVTPADVQDRKQLEASAAEVQEAPGETAELAYGDEGYTGDGLAADAAAYGSR